MRYISLFLLITVVCSCNNKEAFINHKLEYKKTGDCGTDGVALNMNMLSNIAGERYMFDACLDADFDGKDLSIDRKGDSIIVAFARKKETGAVFRLTLDIDAYPVYHHIFFNGQEILVHQEQLLDTN